LKKYNSILILAIGAAVVLLSPSCSTRKNTFTRRVYHNLTGHYNTYWNGLESYREGLLNLNSTVKDNYNKILPVQNYGSKEEAMALNTYMDKAIEKSSINIQRHSMYFGRREYCRWIDDSYLLIGQSFFYKQEYPKAKRTFEFIVNEFGKNDIKFEAMLWLAMTYNQMKKFGTSQSVLDQLRNEADKKKVDKKVLKALPCVRAEHYLLQEKYGPAKEQIEEALSLRQKKKTDTRLRFILGQIYQQEGELYKASDHYLQVIKKNPPYQMDFNARINLAKCYDARYTSAKDILKRLNKMLREDKNKEYRDQIYFALAEIALKDGNDSLTVRYLRLSVASSVSNDFQKAASSLRLAEYLFAKPDYQLAKAYYDTAFQVLPPDYPNYNEIRVKTESLTELVDNLVIIQEEDSLQNLARMPEAERLAVIDKVIEKVKKEQEEQKAREELMASQGMTTMNPQRPGGSSTISPTGMGNWYFYNPQSLSFGYTDFIKKWGKRRLEDNWRLTNKKQVYTEEGSDLAATGDSLTADSTKMVSTDPLSRDTYLQNIPLTEDMLKESNKKIEDAAYNLGIIYRDKLTDYYKSSESFENLLTRFPETEYLLETYYHLYKIYAFLGDQPKADEYKNLIVSKFPESDYARILTDPDYFKKLETQANALTELYGQTYQAYASKDYYTVVNNSNRALSEYQEPAGMIAKFAYLRALSLARIEVADSLVPNLRKIIAKFPDSEVKPLAKNIIDYYTAPQDSTQGVSNEPKVDVSMYEFNPNDDHLFIMLINKKKVNADATKIRISDFNQKYFSLEKYLVNSILLDENQELISVSNFKGSQPAMDYFNFFGVDDYVMSNLSTGDYRIFVISMKNYPVYYKDKDTDKYLIFFEKNYLKK
jgi:tetratricopeptide (TPR) repeat protein